MITDNRFSSIDYASKTETGAEKRERIWKLFFRLNPSIKI